METANLCTGIPPSVAVRNCGTTAAHAMPMPSTMHAYLQIEKEIEIEIPVREVREIMII